MFVTAEQNAMQAELFKIAREKLNDPSLQHDPSNYFLGVFDKSGRQNLGSSPKWGQLPEFEHRALEIVRTKLGIEEAGPVSQAATKPPPPPDNSQPASGAQDFSPESSIDSSLLHQVGALLVSLSIFLLVWVVVGLLLMALDHVRGLGNDWLQSVFRDVFAPWVGGYAGVTAGLTWLHRSTAKFVFFGFSIVVLLLVGAYLGFVGTVRTQVDISVASYVWGAFTLAAGIFGAYKAARDEGFRL